MRVVFWQNMPSHHQAPGLREFAKVWPDEVLGIWCSDIEIGRKQLGWEKPDLGLLREIVLPAKGKGGCRTAHELIEHFQHDIHIFSGFHAYAPIIEAYRHAVRIGMSKLGLMAEPGIQMGWKGLLRPLRAKWIARAYIPSIEVFLVMGQQGVRFYRRAGFDSSVLFPYMYQCDICPKIEDAAVHTPVRFVYVGKFIRRKGVDVMIRALMKCREYSWQLQVIGDGEGRSEIQRLAKAGGLADRIEWVGVQPSSRILSLLNNNDICLVPSRFEGWGVLSNEAIQSGLAVICSDKTTSCELVQTSAAGRIFNTGNPESLSKCIRELLTAPELIVRMKMNAVAYRHRIAPSAVGQYLKEVLAYAFLGEGARRPSPPWLSTDSGSFLENA